MSSRNVTTCLKALENDQFVEHVIIYGDKIAEKSSKFLKKTTFQEFVEQKTNTNESGFLCEPQNVKNTVALILMSSGTTGLPKGVELTQFNFMVASKQYKYV